MSKEVTIQNSIENALMRGDLSKLSEAERLSYYKNICTSLGLNPLTKPMEYMNLNGKLVLYATKGCAEQLRNVHKVSLKVTARESIEGVYVVTAEASLPDGRTDSATGAVTIANLKGEALANAFMKAETKAKRRVTLSLLGLNMLDEVEVESIPQAKNVTPEIKQVAAPAEKCDDEKLDQDIHPALTKYKPEFDTLTWRQAANQYTESFIDWIDNLIKWQKSQPISKYTPAKLELYNLAREYALELASKGEKVNEDEVVDEIPF
mgnify:CR=1 FL=1